MMARDPSRRPIQRQKSTLEVKENDQNEEKYEFDNSVLAGGDWSGTFSHYDGAFTPEQIKKYYDIAMDMDWENEWYSTPDMKADKNRVGYKHISLGGSDTE